VKNIAIAFFLCCVTGLSAQGYVKGELLLELQRDVSPKHFATEISPALQSAGLHLKECISPRLNYWRVGFDTTSISDEDIMLLLRDISAVKTVQWNHNGIEIRGNTPDDPLVVGQWHHDIIQSFDAWSIVTGGATRAGKEIVIAVIDVSFELGHGDLLFFKNVHEIPDNGIDDDRNGYIDDYDGWNAYGDSGQVSLKNAFGTFDPHGTMVCGVAAAKGNNRRDIAGINWNVRILPVQGSSTVESTVLKAYDYVLTMRDMYNRSNGDSGAYIVAANSSFGIGYAFPASYPLWCNMYDTLGKAGVLSVGAGPNTNVNIDVVGDIPCSCPSSYLISVTASTADDRKASTGFGIKSMDIAAPGVEILTTTPMGQTGKGTGTSYAAPLVSGAIALMYAAIPAAIENSESQDVLSLRIRRYLLEDGVDKSDNFTTYVSSGGRLNLYKSVAAALNGGEVGSTENSLQKSVSIFPNPTTDKLVLRGISDFEEVTYFVADLKGQVYLRGKLPEDRIIDVSQLPTGLYFLRWANISGTVVLPLVKR
jgi:subtilisin family serine protease